MDEFSNGHDIFKKSDVIGTSAEARGPQADQYPLCKACGWLNQPSAQHCEHCQANLVAMSREEIRREIRELDSLRFVESNEFSAHYSDIVYHRINVLLDMLDNDNG